MYVINVIEKKIFIMCHFNVGITAAIVLKLLKLLTNDYYIKI